MTKRSTGKVKSCFFVSVESLQQEGSPLHQCAYFPCPKVPDLHNPVGRRRWVA